MGEITITSYLSDGKEIAEELAKGTTFSRIDLYEINGKVYFGEMTFFHCSGFEDFHPEEWNRIFGDWVVLPEKNCEELV